MPTSVGVTVHLEIDDATQALLTVAELLGDANRPPLDRIGEAHAVLLKAFDHITTTYTDPITRKRGAQTPDILARRRTRAVARGHDNGSG